MADDQTPPRQRWEYRVEQYYPDDAPSSGEHRGSGLSSFADRLSEFGADGWELVVVVPLLPYELILRRPLVEDEKKKE